MAEVGAVWLPKSCAFVATYPSPGSAPGMKYAFGVAGSMANTVTTLPFESRLDSVPASPSNGWPATDTLWRSLYRNPSMWSKERFSSIKTTMWLIDINWLVDTLIRGGGAGLQRRQQRSAVR